MGYNSQSLIKDLETAPADGRIQLFPCSNGVFYLKRPTFMQGSLLIIRQNGQEVVLDISGIQSIMAIIEVLQFPKPSTSDIRRIMGLIDEALVEANGKDRRESDN